MTTHPLVLFVASLLGGPIYMAINTGMTRKRLEKYWFIYSVGFLLLPIVVMVIAKNYLLQDLVYINLDLEDLARILPVFSMLYLFINLPFAAMVALLIVPLSRVHNLKFQLNPLQVLWAIIIAVVSIPLLAATLFTPQTLLKDGQQLDSRCFDRPECCQSGKFECQ